MRPYRIFVVSGHSCPETAPDKGSPGAAHSRVLEDVGDYTKSTLSTCPNLILLFRDTLVPKPRQIRVPRVPPTAESSRMRVITANQPSPLSQIRFVGYTYCGLTIG